MIGIRVDVNKHIATGHITRTVAIAEQIAGKGGDCIFISSDDNCVSYLESKGLKYVILDSRWDKKEDELGKLIKIIKELRIASLLVDSYLVTKGYFDALSKETDLFYFDELYLRGYNKCKGLINGLIIPPDYEGYRGMVFKGPEYVPLRSEFIKVPRKTVRDKADTLFLSPGGGDNYHFLRTFLKVFLEDQRFLDFSVNIAVGKYYPVKDIAEYMDNSRVSLYVNTNEISALIIKSDIAVIAGGMTTYEVCSCGTPGIVFSMADNQVEQCKAFDSLGLLKYAGDIRNKISSVVSSVLTNIEEMKDCQERIRMSVKMQKRVDGKGAERIADILLENCDIRGRIK